MPPKNTVKNLEQKKAEITRILDEAYARGGPDAVKATMPADVWAADQASSNPVLATDGWSKDAFSTMFRGMRDRYQPSGGGGNTPAGGGPNVQSATAGMAGKSLIR